MSLLTGLPKIGTLARGHGIREYAGLVEQFCGRYGQKCKGVDVVETDSPAGNDEIHGYP